MVQKNTISNNVIGGIAAAVAAVFTLKTVVDYIQSMEYLPEYYTVGGLLWNLLTLAALAFLAVMLLMRKRSALIAVGFGVMAVGELRALLTPHLSFANRLAELLMEREVIFAEDLEKIFGPRPWTSRSDELMAMNEESKKQPKSTEDLPANDSKTETPHE